MGITFLDVHMVSKIDIFDEKLKKLDHILDIIKINIKFNQTFEDIPGISSKIDAHTTLYLNLQLNQFKLLISSIINNKLDQFKPLISSIIIDNKLLDMPIVETNVTDISFVFINKMSDLDKKLFEIDIKYMFDETIMIWRNEDIDHSDITVSLNKF